MYFNFSGSKIVRIIKQIMFAVSLIVGSLAIVDGTFALPYIAVILKSGAAVNAVGVFLIGKLKPDADEISYDEDYELDNIEEPGGNGIEVTE